MKQSHQPEIVYLWPTRTEFDFKVVKKNVTACREFGNQTDLLDLASDEENTGSAAFPDAFCPEMYSSNVKMS